MSFAGLRVGQISTFYGGRKAIFCRRKESALNRTLSELTGVKAALEKRR